ncbi:MAG: hypothetical protein A2845_03355 [Candidatus Lloydbacteria bacterium RIFCSPHIGHO2_01_FULL_49_22]|uniref:Glycosyltransferase subfamily 4-like N-terminal domain-containing protein n=1 Tax=Candidatus Lloydbacteria bacterium RIFCSPHIGHO2_01_FULL_49_22 TaxID=1798658 RepID=A0A1G2CWQ9_9BACT|nr:MAG: hypothetical protein A2845_03355 [Candidatus Lloydbacteria bacterium RIFCSPHIGHO2_01_FULL_49_22]OGZ08968.1 MAG: hypothetical protein A3C14_03190 [Candidatus Lloydbacteria bacterium RIFCSPHIGHO2_02_FULL_50_18]
MIIELTGLPGSGKSTFAKKLVQEGEWQIVRTNGMADILWNNCCFALRHPIYFSRGFFAMIRFCGARQFWYTKFMNLFLVHNAKYMKASRMSHAIIDQGHHQNIISLFDEKASDVVLRTYLAKLPQPDALVLFAADEDVRASRLRARGYGARENVEGGLREAWEDARGVNFELLYAIRSELPVTTMVVTPENEEEQLGSLAHFRLWRFVMHLRMPTEKAHGLQIANTLQALSRAGQQVELWVTKRKNAISENVFTYYGLSERFPVRYLRVLPALRLTSILGAGAYWLEAAFFMIVLLMERIDTSMIYYTRNAEVAWLLGKKGATVFYEAHLWPSGKSVIFRFFLQGVKGIVANSEGTAEVFRKNGFSNTEVIRNGADLEKFSIDMTREDARKKIDLPLDGDIIMYVGSFARWKGVATLRGAWAKLRKQFPNAHLVMVGGTTKDLTHFPECRELAGDTQCIVRGHLPSSMIPTYLRAADILVLPNEPVSEESIRFTSPIKLFEYMASGRPIVASDLPSMREILNETNASLFISGDKDDLARSIADLLVNKGAGDEHAKNASALVREYSWEARARRLVAFVDSSR